MKNISPKEFREIGRKKDWTNYSERVLKRINEVADKYEKAQRRSRI